MITLTYDVLLQIFSSSTHEELFNVSLANQEFNSIASKYLYVNVYIVSLFDSRFTNDSVTPTTRQFYSAILPEYASLVRNLVIYGDFSAERLPSVLKLDAALQESLKAFTNIQSVSFRPTDDPSNYFSNYVEAIRILPSLKHLTLNSTCLEEPQLNHYPTSQAAKTNLASIAEDEEEEDGGGSSLDIPTLRLLKADMLASISSLETLTIFSPDRRILQQLIPNWLNRLSQTLVELHLLNNCGSITPGVLRAAIPHLHNIQSFSLGLSYSLTDSDVFEALSQLPRLHSLCLAYYAQHTSPPYFPILRSLKSFRVKHAGPEETRECQALCKWIRKVITHCPLESLTLEQESSVYHQSNPTYDGLVDHLVSVHAKRLRVLDMNESFVGTSSFEKLCKKCTKLEKLSIGVNWDTLGTFIQDSRLPKLDTLSLNVLNVTPKQRAAWKKSEFMEIMVCSPSLRRVTLNELKWEGAWVVGENDGKTRFDIEPTTNKYPPGHWLLARLKVPYHL